MWLFMTMIKKLYDWNQSKSIHSKSISIDSHGMKHNHDRCCKTLQNKSNAQNEQHDSLSSSHRWRERRQKEDSFTTRSSQVEDLNLRKNFCQILIAKCRILKMRWNLSKFPHIPSMNIVISRSSWFFGVNPNQSLLEGDLLLDASLRKLTIFSIDSFQ